MHIFAVCMCMRFVWLLCCVLLPLYWSAPPAHTKLCTELSSAHTIKSRTLSLSLNQFSRMHVYPIHHCSRVHNECFSNSWIKRMNERTNESKEQTEESDEMKKYNRNWNCVRCALWIDYLLLLLHRCADYNSACLICTVVVWASVCYWFHVYAL